MILFGICMGAADLVPGISGGTIAFVLGFYHPLMDSLKSIHLGMVKNIFRGQWRLLVSDPAFRFLSCLLIGIATAFILFAHLFHSLLQNEISRAYLYAGFFGLVLASFIFCLQKVSQWDWKLIVGLFAGFAFSYYLTSALSLDYSLEGSFLTQSFWLYGWLFICGMAAVCALLLPGVSGSYLLILFGVYPLVIKALVDFISGLKSFSIDIDAFLILLSLGSGVMIGALFFARCVSRFFSFYPNGTLAILSGFMIGGIHAIWPFHSIDLVPITDVWLASGLSVAAFILFFFLEKTAKRLHLESSK